MSVSALAALSALDVASAAMVTLLFGYLSLDRSSGRSPEYLRWWTLGWIFLTVAEGGAAAIMLGADVPGLGAILGLSAFGLLLCLMSGTYRFLGRRLGRAWWVACGLAGASVPIVELATGDPVLAISGPIMLTAVGLLVVGVALFRSRGGRHRLSGAALVLWAVHAADYPFLSEVESFAPWGVALSAVLQTSVGVGLVLAHVRESKAELAEVLARERALIEEALVGIYRATPAGAITLANPAFLELTGYEDLGALQHARRAGELFADSEGESNDDGDAERLLRRSDGTIRCVRMHRRAIRDPSGTVELYEGVAIDVTQRRQLEEQLEAAHRMQAVGALTGGIAHDFNNLLQVILASAGVAARDAPSEALDNALEAARRAADLTRQLLAFARSHREEVRSTDLVAHSGVLTKLLRGTLRARVRLTLGHERDACHAAVRSTDVDQILLNLIVNARDAMPSGGGISVRTSEAERSHPDAPSDEARRWAVLEVRDDGPGLEDAVRERLFEPFFTTRGSEGGAGLGLSIVAQVAERVGGFVEVRSERGDGAMFRVYLPRAPAPDAARALERSSAAAPEGGRLLLVDDDPEVRAATAALLRRAGWEVLEADGVEAAAAAIDASLRAVITDVVMGDGSGTELFERARERGLELPILLVSGYPDADVGLDGDVPYAVLAKPYEEAELLEAVAGLLTDEDPPARDPVTEPRAEASVD